MNSDLFLVLQAKGNPAFATRLKLGDLTIGRSDQNDISLDIDTISRNHARLSVGTQGVIATDLQSRNGTWVNRKRVQNAPVFPGELIQFGVVEFILSRDPRGGGGQNCDEETRDARSVRGIDQLTPAPLSPAQTRVFNLLVQGHLEKEIAVMLGRSVDTIHNHTRRIYEAFGVHSKVELLLQVMPRSAPE
jgi:pSer/pThr/pTyr-binding forkhead associated (FHA) protein